jgi:protein-S-isoprenylcysteine O-methyltransferase Ste14
MSMLELKIPPVLVTILFFLLMWLVSRLTPEIPVPPELKLASLFLFSLAGGCIGLAGVASFRKACTTVNTFTPDASSSLVVSGIFKRTRNPMYLALFLALFGWGLYLANLISLVVAAGFVVYMNHFQILPEERALENAFGARFTEYKSRVRRWI